MNARSFLAATAVAALITGAPMLANAADSTVSVKTEAHAGNKYQEVKSDDVVVSKFDLTVDKIKGKDIKNADGKIGDVDKVLMNDKGDVVGVTADVGGFLGAGSKEVMLSLDQLKLQDGDFVTDMTKDQLKAQPAYED